MRFISVQPRLFYYAWQVEVMINNFLHNGVDPEKIDVLIGVNSLDDTCNPGNIQTWEKLIKGYPKVNFYIYQDTRQQPIRYISSIRPNILKQHFAAFPELNQETFFYHDCDIALTRPVEFTDLEEGTTWYGSDTVSYIGHDYILSKGQDILDKMCEIVGISSELVKQNQLNSIGAQYILKNLDANFWQKVEQDAEVLFYQINQLSSQKKSLDPSYHELQIWCADMWALLWNGWLRGHQTRVTKKLDFCWPMEGEVRWREAPLFHNAGIGEYGKYFYKAGYMSRLPYDDKLDLDPLSCSARYFDEIKKVKSCLYAS